MRDDGTEEARVSGHVDCDVSHILAINALIRDAMAELLPQGRLAQGPGGATTH